MEFSYAAAEDANLKGLKRAKKVMTHGKGKARFEMQDAHSVFVPFQCSGISGAGLFCIFDGHAGKNCALECAAIVPKLAEKNIAELAMRGPLTDAREALEKTFLEADQVREREKKRERKKKKLLTFFFFVGVAQIRG